MTALIIEDEIPAAERLKRLLTANGFHVVDTLPSCRKARLWASENPHPDFVFADVRLRDGISFDIFESISFKSRIVFTTAYDEYALRAFEVNGVDYLLKPVDEAKLRKLASKLKLLAGGLPDDPVEDIRTVFGKSPPNTIVLTRGSKIRISDPHRIMLFFSRNNATYAVEDGREYLVSSSLEKLHAELDSDDFFRISRKFIINRRFIREVSANSTVEMTMTTDFGQELAVSRSRSTEFLQWFKKKALRK